MKHNSSRRQRLPFINIIFFSLLFLFTLPSWSQLVDDELLSVTEEASVKAKSSVEAQREIQKKIIDGIARDQIIEMIGQKRYQKNRSMVENRLVKESAKYIPFIQPGEVQRLPDGQWKMKLELKLSTESLKKMVIDTGLLSDANIPVTMIPMITYTDRVKGISYRWWLGDSQDEMRKPLVDWAHSVEDHLNQEFMRQGFHLILPLDDTISNQLPQAFRVDRASSQDLRAIGQYLGISMVVRGDVRIKSRGSFGASSNHEGSQINVKLEVVQVQGGRTVAEISRTFEIDAMPTDLVIKKRLEKESDDLSRDLASQVYEAWTRGTLAATTLRLTVKGNLSPKQWADFRSQLTRSKSMRNIKAIRERLFEPGQVTYEIDYAASAEEFRQKMKTLQLSNFQEKFLDDSSSDGIRFPFVFEVKPRG